MISKDSRKHLIELCDVFINTGNDVTQPTIIRSSVNFNISQYIKFEDQKLSVLITNVDTDGLGASSTQGVASEQVKPIGNPGEWNVESFLGP